MGSSIPGINIVRLELGRGISWQLCSRRGVFNLKEMQFKRGGISCLAKLASSPN